jgi:hypothetical protein
MNDPWNDLVWRIGVTVVTSVVGVVVTLTANYYWQRWLSFRLRRSASRYEQEHGSREVALLLSTRENIQEAALAYLKKTNRGDIVVFSVHQPEGFSDREGQWLGYLEKVKAEVRKIRELGTSRIYVFSNLPVAMAIFAGATLTNGPGAVIHHFSTAMGTYHEVGLLTVESIKL